MRCNWNLAQTEFENDLDFFVGSEGREELVKKEENRSSKLGVKEFRLE